MMTGFKKKKFNKIDPQFKAQLDGYIKVLAKLEMERDTLGNAANFQDRYFLWKPLDDRCKVLKNELLQLGQALGVTKQQIDATIEEEKSITTKP